MYTVADNDEEEDDLDTPESEIPNLVQKLLKEKKFEDALKLTKKATESIPYFSNLR